MRRPFFVMIYAEDGESAGPLVDGEGVLFFSTLEEALTSGGENRAGQTFGFEVFECGAGVYGS